MLLGSAFAQDDQDIIQLILSMNTFRITASAWAARMWTTGEGEVEQPARPRIIIPHQPATSWRKVRLGSRELLGRGSTWGRDGSSQAQAFAQNCCRRPRLWTAMTKVSRERNLKNSSMLIFNFLCVHLLDWNFPAGLGGARQPFSFVSQEVVEATCQCLLAQAEEGEKKGKDIEQIERIVLEEFGRCLVQIIDFAGKAKKS